MNKLQEAIAKLEADMDRSELNERLLQMLLEKQEELGSDISDEEAEEAAGEVFKEHLLEALRSVVPHVEDDSDDEEWSEIMEDAMEVVHRVFRKRGWKYHDYTHQKGVKAFEMGIRENGKQLHVKVYLESAAKVCRIDAMFPFQAERDFAYPLCEKLMKENYPRRFGVLQYDERDGELSYRYSFSIRHGLHEDDFQNLLMAVMASAYASYDVVKQFAVARFRKPERDTIICQAQKLIIELDQ
ncbi:MAG: YbjN domain-containing protein [Oscillospiraceae bacterium]